MIISLSQMDLSRLRRRHSRVDAILFTPHEIDFSRLRGRAYEDAVFRMTGIPALAFETANPRVISTGKLLPSISPDAKSGKSEIGSSIPYVQEKPFLGSVNGRVPRGIIRKRSEA